MSETDPHARPPAVHERPTWLTYAQAGELLGLSPEAVRHRARRNNWRTQPGNDGRTLVMISAEDITDARSKPPVHTDDRAPVRANGVDEEIARANARADRGDERAEEAAKRADVAVALADRTLVQLAEERQRTEALRERLDALHHDLTAAEIAATEARAALDAARQQATDAQAAAEAAQTRADAADTDRRAAEARADRAAKRAEHLDGEAQTLRANLDKLRDGQTLMAETHARDLAEAIRRAEDAVEETIRQRMDRLEHDRATSVAIADEAVKAAEQLRQAETERKGRGRWSRLRGAWRGE